MMMAASLSRCYTTVFMLISLWLLTTILVAAAAAGDVAYRDVITNRKSNYLSRYFRRLQRRQRDCKEPELAERVRMADFILTGTIRGLEVDTQQPSVEVARVEVKRIFKEHGQVYIMTTLTL